MKVKVKMLTERGLIPVQRAYVRGNPDRVEVDVCVDCGAVVVDIVRHDRRHRSMERESDDAQR